MQRSCPEGKERSIKSGRCVKKCSNGKERSSKSGRCVKKCQNNEYRFARSGRCRKIKLCPPNQEVSSRSGKCVKKCLSFARRSHRTGRCVNKKYSPRKLVGRQSRPARRLSPIRRPQLSRSRSRSPEQQNGDNKFKSHETQLQFQVFEEKGKGRGIKYVGTNTLKAGTKLMIFKGRYVDYGKKKDKDLFIKLMDKNLGLWQRRYMIEIIQGLIIIPKGNTSQEIKTGAFLINGTNREASANCLIKINTRDKIANVVSRKPIKPGDTLTLFYSDDYEF